MATFHSPQDFLGSYRGSYDGRQALLEITDLKDDSPSPSFHLRFTDLDRNAEFVGTHIETGQQPHILTNIALTHSGGEGAVNWSKLFLHTWNTSYLSGVSVWNNTDYGMSFSRGPDVPVPAGNPSFQGYQDWFGTYQGSYDGRKAIFEITLGVTIGGDGAYDFRFTDLDQNEVYKGGLQIPERGTHIIRFPFQLLSLKQEGGDKVITWYELLLHTWNTNYLSGISVWNGVQYGMSFSRALLV